MSAHCVIEDVTDKWDQIEGDKQLGDMLIKHDGDAQKLLTTVLDFLKRKSNFFKGDVPKQRLLEAFKEVRPANERDHNSYQGHIGALCSMKDLPLCTCMRWTFPLAPFTQVAGEAAPVAGVKAGFPAESKPVDKV